MNILLLTGTLLGSILFLVYFVYFLFMRQQCKYGASWKKGRISTKVSLIIATYNEESTLPAKLKNVLELDYPKKLLELVIIDSGSTDKTVEIVDDFIKKNSNMNVLFIREPERLGKSHALNVAYPKASGTIKIISDSDALLEKNAITQIVSNFNDSSVGAACGREIMLNAEENPSTRLEKSYRGIYQVLRKGESVVDSTPIFNGELSAYRSELIELLPENKSADDSRLANLVKVKGFRSVFDSDAIFYEYAPSSFKSRIIQKVRRGQGLIRVFWDFKKYMFRRKYGAYGMVILPVEFSFHSIFPALWMFAIVTFLLGVLIHSWFLFLALFVGSGCVYALAKLNTDNFIQKKLRAFIDLIMSFLSSQFFLFYGLILWVSGRSLHKWQKVEDVRKNYGVKKEQT